MERAGPGGLPRRLPADHQYSYSRPITAHFFEFPRLSPSGFLKKQIDTQLPAVIGKIGAHIFNTSGLKHQKYLTQVIGVHLYFRVAQHAQATFSWFALGFMFALE